MAVLEPRAAAQRRATGPPDEAAARRTLRAQIARLEAQLAVCAAQARPGDGIAWSAGRPAPAGPRLLGLGELERLRDDLAERLHATRATLAARARREAAERVRLERVLRDPAAHPFARVTREQVGLPGCGAWEVRPRLGPVGLLAGWWRVKLSSGCPLA